MFTLLRAWHAIRYATLPIVLILAALDAGYGNVQVLHGLTLTLAPGEVLCVMGRNGAGKSTALKAIMGLVPPAPAP